MTLEEQCVLHSKSGFCMNKVSFTTEILSLWLHGPVPPVSHSSQRINHLQSCWLEHFFAQTEVVPYKYQMQ